MHASLGQLRDDPDILCDPASNALPIVPVILAGGGGARLWPLSNPRRPKPFLPLLDGLSTFRETLARAVLAPGVDMVLVVANQAHRALIEAETRTCAVPVHLVLEPAARDSAAAIAAAAQWLATRRPGVVAAFISADHHVPDQAAFAAALRRAADAAVEHRIVTLGLRPDGPSTAFGYIRPLPEGGAVARVGAFVEKPDRATAERYRAAGYLWNSGNFICRPESLLAELDVHAPEITAIARAAVADATEAPAATILADGFANAPAISIDRALMERTTQAAVLPADFQWSDIGSWRAVLAASARDGAGNSVEGDVHLQDCTGCLARAPGRVQLAMIGLRDIAVVANQNGDLLVCDLAASEEIREVARRFQTWRSGAGEA